ncbi:MAG TPA: hypothetical protein VMH23_14445 [Bacteroidota bacterium]|nr:hypothetical protein [Bacteroidota bacterium]
MLQIAAELAEFEHWFSPHFADGFLGMAQRLGFLDFTTPGKKWVNRILSVLKSRNVKIDYRGRRGPYALIVFPTDLIVPSMIRRTPSVLVQEGMTDPESATFTLIRRLPFLPRWLASSAAYGLSDAYSAICVASEGYRELFVKKGVRREKIRVTGIPGFDRIVEAKPRPEEGKGYVLVCTSDARENYRYENRKAFIRRAMKIAAGRPVVFKLHPNEKLDRAWNEIRRHAPTAEIIMSGKAEDLVPECSVLITKWSTVAYTGLALGKEVYSDFPLEQLKQLMPVQNGRAAREIAAVCREVLGVEEPELVPEVAP